MLKMVQEDVGAYETGGSVLDEIVFVMVPGRCWRRRCGPRSRRMSRPMPARLMIMVAGWWCGERVPRRPGGDHGSGCGRGPTATSQRQRTDPVTGKRKRFASAILPAWTSAKASDEFPRQRTTALTIKGLIDRHLVHFTARRA